MNAITSTITRCIAAATTACTRENHLPILSRRRGSSENCWEEGCCCWCRASIFYTSQLSSIKFVLLRSVVKRPPYTLEDLTSAPLERYRSATGGLLNSSSKDKSLPSGLFERYRRWDKSYCLFKSPLWPRIKDKTEGLWWLSTLTRADLHLNFIGTRARKTSHPDEIKGSRGRETKHFSKAISDVLFRSKFESVRVIPL